MKCVLIKHKRSGPYAPTRSTDFIYIPDRDVVLIQLTRKGQPIGYKLATEWDQRRIIKRYPDRLEKSRYASNYIAGEWEKDPDDVDTLLNALRKIDELSETAGEYGKRLFQ